MLIARLRDLLCAARDEARAQGINAEFMLHRERSSLLRLGNSAIALSTAEELTRLNVSITAGRRTGGFSITADLTSLEQVREALAGAGQLCAAGPELDYEPFFGAVEEAIDDEHGCDPELADYSPVKKAELCAEVLETLRPFGNFNFSGSWSSGETEIYYISTANEREAYRRLTDGRLLLVLKDNTRQWELAAEQTGARAADFSAPALINEFSTLLPVYEKSPYRAPLEVTRVVFGPQAIAELCMLMVDSGFYGRGWEEGQNFTSGKQFGARLFSPMITLTDNPTHPQVFGRPFDHSGQRRRPLTLAAEGLFHGLAYDSTTAAKYHKAPTGHDLDYWDMVLAPGSAPSGLAAGLELAGDALYIPFLHYTHLPDPSRGQFTGSSRFNAVCVAQGQMVAPLVSTRITDTLPNVLSNVVALSSRSVSVNLSLTYGPRDPVAFSVPEYMICDAVRISDVAEKFA